MKLKIVTRNGAEVDEEVKSVILSASDGEMQILPDHAPTVLMIKPGVVRYNGSSVRIGRALIKVDNNDVLILAEGRREKV